LASANVVNTIKVACKGISRPGDLVTPIVIPDIIYTIYVDDNQGRIKILLKQLNRRKWFNNTFLKPIKSKYAGVELKYKFSGHPLKGHYLEMFLIAPSNQSENLLWAKSLLTHFFRILYIIPHVMSSDFRIFDKTLVLMGTSQRDRRGEG